MWLLRDRTKFFADATSGLYKVWEINLFIIEWKNTDKNQHAYSSKSETVSPRFICIVRRTKSAYLSYLTWCTPWELASPAYSKRPPLKINKSCSSRQALSFSFQEKQRERDTVKTFLRSCSFRSLSQRQTTQYPKLPRTLFWERRKETGSSDLEESHTCLNFHQKICTNLSDVIKSVSGPLNSYLCHFCQRAKSQPPQEKALPLSIISK